MNTTQNTRTDKAEMLALGAMLALMGLAWYGVVFVLSSQFLHAV